MAINIDLGLDKVFTVELHKEEKEEKDRKDGTEPSEELVHEGENYRYPLSLTRNYPAHITFTAFPVEAIDFAEIAGDAFKALSERYKRNARNTKSPDSEDVSEADAELSDDEQSKIEELNTQLVDKSYENLELGNRVGSVMLPLQRSLTFQDGVQYNVANLGIAGGLASNALGGGNPFAGVLDEQGNVTRAASGIAANILAKNVGTLLGAAAGSAKGLLASGIGAVAGSNIGEGVGAAVRSATRVTTNPNQRTLFENVNMREFSFTFKMIANNAKEAQEIKNIVKFFRRELYPEPIETANGIPFAYEFPNVFQIDIKNFAGEDPAPKIQNCYLVNVQTVYNGTANSMHLDGNFVEVEISLSFREITALNKKKVRDGGF